MRSSLGGVDVVGVAEDVFRIAVGVLEGHLHIDPFFFPLEVNHLIVQLGLVGAKVFHKRNDSPLKLKDRLPFLLPALIEELDQEPFVQEGQFPKAFGQNIVGENVRFLKDGPIRLKGDFGAGRFGLADDGELGCGLAALVALVMDLAVALDLHLQPVRKRIDAADPHAMEAPRHLISLMIELPAGMERC